MGIRREIEPSGLFPAVVEEDQLEASALDAWERWERNHPSFSRSQDGNRPPGFELLEEHLNAGFGELYHSIHDAEAALNSKVYPAPLGTISKMKLDGTENTGSSRISAGMV